MRLSEAEPPTAPPAETRSGCRRFPQVVLVPTCVCPPPPPRSSSSFFFSAEKFKPNVIRREQKNSSGARNTDVKTALTELEAPIQDDDLEVWHFLCWREFWTILNTQKSNIITNNLRIFPLKHAELPLVAGCGTAQSTNWSHNFHISKTCCWGLHTWTAPASQLPRRLRTKRRRIKISAWWFWTFHFKKWEGEITGSGQTHLWLLWIVYDGVSLPRSPPSDEEIGIFLLAACLYLNIQSEFYEHKDSFYWIIDTEVQTFRIKHLWLLEVSALIRLHHHSKLKKKKNMHKIKVWAIYPEWPATVWRWQRPHLVRAGRSGEEEPVVKLKSLTAVKLRGRRPESWSANSEAQSAVWVSNKI